MARECPDSTFYVIDNDHAYERMLEGDEFSGLRNIDHRLILDRNDFEQTTETFDNVLSLAKPDDWIVIDMLDPTWDGVQEFWTEKIYGTDIDDYFIAVKQKKNAGNSAGEVDRSFVELDWPAIKKVYTKRVMNKIVNARCHLMCTAAIKAIDRTRDKEDVLKYFGTMKGKPAGNKDVPHLFHTIIMLDNEYGKWVMTTAKDREREKMERVEVEDFAVDYLVNVAGWEKEAVVIKRASRRKTSETE